MKHAKKLARNGHKRKPQKAPCSIRPLGQSSAARNKSSLRASQPVPHWSSGGQSGQGWGVGDDLCVLLWLLLVQAAVYAPPQLSLSGRIPPDLQYSGTGREAQAALGSCLVCLCLKQAWLDALSSDVVQRRENKRHSCRVRGSAREQSCHTVLYVISR